MKSVKPTRSRAILEKFLFSDGIGGDEVSELTGIAQYREYAPGELILAQGAVNNQLFFLITGSIRVERSGETIATLSNPGDVLGEMSLITQKECAASIFAITPIYLLVLELEKVKHLSDKLQALFTNALNKLFSVILAKKLAITNEKARLFEITNRQLQDAKKALENASKNKIDEMAADQKGVALKLQDIVNHKITPLSNAIAKVMEEPQTHPEFAEIANRVNKILEELAPMAIASAVESSLKNKRVLLLEDDVNEQINAKMSLGGTGVVLTVISDQAEAKTALQKSRFDIVCVNSNFSDLIPFGRLLSPDSKYVFVSSEPISKHFHTLKQHPELSTIVARHPVDRTFTVKNMATTIRKLFGGDIFGLEKYLSWGTEVIEHKITGSADKAALVAHLETFLDSLGIRGSLRSKGSRVAEELLMNAVYDAPTDKDGKSIYNHLERNVPVQLKPEEYATFRYACDGALLAISVVDVFGALTRSTILDYLERCFGEFVLLENMPGKGGGGNGLFQIIQSSSLTVFNVKPGRKTEVIALLNINIQTQKISLHPSFHYFEAQL